ncbi:uncharacterized protein BXZ73DRAFT_97584 [Epithele typhae]|uniref:uncharacterized protein n=1 Tax=Epithele typhae TaxID=378194 RepID=UPI0020088B66|nr:uncharacterized protein BXZ73DRAFT_97584 [Epithele typhae]KAH9942163.1 hypothetical protein BXZ73DRAFT_97584 [Epithele typhae]
MNTVIPRPLPESLRDMWFSRHEYEAALAIHSFLKFAMSADPDDDLLTTAMRLESFVPHVIYCLSPPLDVAYATLYLLWNLRRSGNRHLSSGHGLFLVALRLAWSVLEDPGVVAPYHRWMDAIPGLYFPVSQFTALEIKFCAALDWKVGINREDFLAFKAGVRTWVTERGRLPLEKYLEDRAFETHPGPGTDSDPKGTPSYDCVAHLQQAVYHCPNYEHVSMTGSSPDSACSIGTASSGSPAPLTPADAMEVAESPQAQPCAGPADGREASPSAPHHGAPRESCRPMAVHELARCALSLDHAH